MKHTSLHAAAGLTERLFDGHPVATLIVDGDLRLLGANRAARELLEHEPGAGRRAGDALECLHSLGPGGCGCLDLCKDCVIRRSVNHAFSTGAVQRAKAFVRLRREGREVVVGMLVSASSIDEDGKRCVVLALEDISNVACWKDELTEAEQASLENETLRRSLFELAPTAVVLVGEDGRILQFNEQAHRQLGYTREEFASLHVSDLDPDEPRDDADAGFARALDIGGAEFEASHRAKSGEIRRMLVKSRPVEIQGERRIVSVWQDVTERKRAEEAAGESEEALRASEERFRAIFEQAAVGMAQGDARTGRFLRVNDKLCEIVGYAREEMLARGWQDLTHPDDLQTDRDSYARMLASHSSYARQKRYIRKDGLAVWVNLTIAPMWPAGAEPTSHVAVVEDITGRKCAEDALRRSEERFRALIENSTDLIVVLDTAARCQFWSPSATEALGWTAAEMKGRSVFELIHADDRQRVTETFGAVIAEEGATVRLPLRYQHKDGTWRQIESFARNLLHEPAVRGVVVNSRDMTEQRRLEEQFQQAQKLESIGRLAGGIAHDFNNLLTVILAGAEALRDAPGEAPPPDGGIVEEIAAAGRRARVLTRQLLAFARRQVIAPVPLDLNNLMRDSEKLLRRVMGEDVELAATLQPGLWPVRCDPGQIEQVILNLAVNARDAMPRGGKLTIETANVEFDESLTTSHPGMRPEACVRLSVRDSGPGLSAEVKAHLFEPFFTTKPVGQGTGLGLATVYGIVKQNEGHIQVDSEPGQGATFNLFFPRIAESAATAAPPAPATVTRGAETILVVEDDPQVREVTVRSLRAGGYRVLVAADGRGALDVAGHERGVHLLVTDVVMPGMSGREVADELCRRQPTLRVLYVSGYTHDAIAQRGVLDSGVEFLQKPFTASSLLERVRSVLDAL